MVSRSRVFEIGNFDARAAAELALMNRDTLRLSDEKNKAEPYQKRKVDRQIVAICKVYGVTELYTDDGGIAATARLCGITPIGIADIPIPTSALQHSFVLEPHEEIPKADDEEPADSK